MMIKGTPIKRRYYVGAALLALLLAKCTFSSNEVERPLPRPIQLHEYQNNGEGYQDTARRDPDRVQFNGTQPAQPVIINNVPAAQQSGSDGFLNGFLLGNWFSGLGRSGNDFSGGNRPTVNPTYNTTNNYHSAPEQKPSNAAFIPDAQPQIALKNRPNSWEQKAKPTTTYTVQPAKSVFSSTSSTSAVRSTKSSSSVSYKPTSRSNSFMNRSRR